MDKTEEFYKAIGSDFQSVAKRFGNNSAMVTQFVLKFLSDESFRTLKAALEKDDAGMTGFVPKPLNINELLCAISKQASNRE